MVKVTPQVIMSRFFQNVQKTQQNNKQLVAIT